MSKQYCDILTHIKTFYLGRIQAETGMFNNFWLPFWADNFGNHPEIWL